LADLGARFLEADGLAFAGCLLLLFTLHGFRGVLTVLSESMDAEGEVMSLLLMSPDSEDLSCCNVAIPFAV